MSLEKLIRPKSMAIVGVTDREGSFGMHTARNALASENTDRIYFVHPKRDELFGKKCYPTLQDLPETVDCVILCTPAKTVNGLLKEAGELGVKAAMVFASGFSEELTTEGIRLENEMVDIGKEYDMKILGPNCMGIYNNVDKMNMWGLGFPEEVGTNGGGIGIVAQSGSIAATLVHTGYINAAYAISSGNGNVTPLEEFFDFLVDDDQVKVVSLYLEGVKDAKLFSQALGKAAQQKKPVVVLKAGRSEKGATSAASHTGNLAGSREAYESVFEKFGVIVVEDLEQLICMTQLLSILDGRYPEKPTFGAVTLSGGENVIYADLAEEYGVDLPDILDSTKEEMRNYLPGFATPKNPLDATTALFRNEEKVIGLMNAFEKDPNIGAVLLGGTLGLKFSPIWKIFCESIVKAKENGCLKPAFLSPPREGAIHSEYRKIVENAGIPLLSSVGTGMKCLNRLSGFVTYSPTKRTLNVAVPETKDNGRDSYALSEFDSKVEIARRGVPIPVQKIAADQAGLQEAIKGMSFPIVLKINSPDILHKSDVGAVKLSIKDEAETTAAFDEIMTNVKTHAPDAKLEGMLIQEMAPEGIETIIGVTNDIQFGPMLLVGLGGVFVEVFNDVALYPVPLNKDEAINMIRQLKGFKLLSGYRGGSPCDVEALAEVMVNVSDYASEHKDDLKELDLNPVFVYPEGKGVCAADAMIVKYKT
jgi:acyl-CoA synthetase (NDP forming)